MNIRPGTVILAGGLGLFVAACGFPASSGEGGSGSGSSGGGTGGLGNSETGVMTGAMPTSTGVVSPTASTGEVGTDGTSEGSGESSSTGCSFICETTGANGHECDNFGQDCPEGQKCAAWNSDGGGSWNALKCVPVMGDQQPGEPCFAPEGGTSGLDDCAKGVMCWDVDENKVGVCVALCGGVPETPICPKDGPCFISGEGWLNLCLPECDPLVQDCMDEEDVCIVDGSGFFCVPDASGADGQANDACEFDGACDEGLTCLDPVEASSACDPRALGCCQPFCEFPGGGCPNLDQACVQWYDPMDVSQDSPKLKYGVCKVPE